MVKSITLMRHAEREDRAMELQGKDWISTAPRPQDPILSEKGRRQAAQVGKLLKDVGITKILSSPMIRTVITSDIIAEELGLGLNSVNVEMGLVEEAKSFRGKTAAEPRPNWNPLILPPSELAQFSTHLNLDYKTINEVHHIRDEEALNTVRELHDTLSNRDEITRDRCRVVLKNLIECEDLKNDSILCVGHGATVGAMMKAFQAELPEDLWIKGERAVSCFAEFRPVDENNPLGPWKSVTGSWGSGNLPGDESKD